MVEIEQREGNAKPEINNRIIATPNWHEALSTLGKTRDLPSSVRKQIEQFFVSTDVLTSKILIVKGWGSSEKANEFIDKNRL